MNIHTSFPGGNARILSIEGDDVHLLPDQRDSHDWFYWAFCVEGAQGRTLNFCFEKQNLVGYWGAAVSDDALNWRWSENAQHDGEGFTYTFGPEEGRVYFCHDMNYPVRRFAALAERLGLPFQTLCVSEKGAAVPMVRLGSEGSVLLTTSRHHCCESTGTYLMEGILREFAHQPPQGFQIIAIPFVDYDGADAGDQGKNRFPHDHNRDYIDEPVWKSTAAIMELAKREDICWALDLHAPWHRTHEHDHSYILRTPENDNRMREIFSRLLEAETQADRRAFPFWHRFAFDHYFANPGSFVHYFSRQKGVELALTIETTYFGHYGCKVSQDNLVELGACVSRALRLICSAV